MGMSRYDIALGKRPPRPKKPKRRPPNPKILILGVRRSGKTETLINEMMKVSGSLSICAPRQHMADEVRHRYMHRMQGLVSKATNIQTHSCQVHDWGFSGYDGTFLDEAQELSADGYASGLDRALTRLSRISGVAVATCDLGRFFARADRWGMDTEEWHRIGSHGLTEHAWSSFTYLGTSWQTLFLPTRHLVAV